MQERIQQTKWNSIHSIQFSSSNIYVFKFSALYLYPVCIFRIFRFFFSSTNFWLPFYNSSKGLCQWQHLCIFGLSEWCICITRAIMLYKCRHLYLTNLNITLSSGANFTMFSFYVCVCVCIWKKTRIFLLCYSSITMATPQNRNRLHTYWL